MKGILRIWEVSTASAAVWMIVGMGYYHLTGHVADAAVVAAGVLVAVVAVTLHTHSADISLTISATALAGAGIALVFATGIPALAYAGFFVAVIFAFFVAIAAQREDRLAEHSGLYFLPALPLGFGTIIGGAVLLVFMISRHQKTKRLSVPLGAQHA